MKIKIFKPKKKSDLRTYGYARSDDGPEYDIIHLKKPLTLTYICTCKGFLFGLKCKHLKAYKIKEDRLK